MPPKVQVKKAAAKAQAKAITKKAKKE